MSLLILARAITSILTSYTNSLTNHPTHEKENQIHPRRRAAPAATPGRRRHRCRRARTRRRRPADCPAAGPHTVRTFASFTDELHAMADWLAQCGIKTIAMESTGVYWIPAYQILEARGFEVCLINARQTASIGGRGKTDVCDAQWLQYLHACGLLRASHRPPAQVCAVRCVLRHRERTVRAAAASIQHLQ